jgi:hypothetical protein
MKFVGSVLAAIIVCFSISAHTSAPISQSSKDLLLQFAASEGIISLLDSDPNLLRHYVSQIPKNLPYLPVGVYAFNKFHALGEKLVVQTKSLEALELLPIRQKQDYLARIGRLKGLSGIVVGVAGIRLSACLLTPDCHFSDSYHDPKHRLKLQAEMGGLLTGYAISSAANVAVASGMTLLASGNPLLAGIGYVGGTTLVGAIFFTSDRLYTRWRTRNLLFSHANENLRTQLPGIESALSGIASKGLATSSDEVYELDIDYDIKMFELGQLFAESRQALQIESKKTELRFLSQMSDILKYKYRVTRKLEAYWDPKKNGNDNLLDWQNVKYPILKSSIDLWLKDKQLAKLAQTDILNSIDQKLLRLRGEWAVHRRAQIERMQKDLQLLNVFKYQLTYLTTLLMSTDSSMMPFGSALKDKISRSVTIEDLAKLSSPFWEEIGNSQLQLDPQPDGKNTVGKASQIWMIGSLLDEASDIAEGTLFEKMVDDTMAKLTSDLK